MSFSSVSDRESQKRYRLPLEAIDSEFPGGTAVEELLGPLHVQDKKFREPMDSEV